MNNRLSQSPLQVIQDDTADEDLVCEAAQELLIGVDLSAVQPLLQRLSRAQDPPWVRSYLVTALGGIIASYDTIPEETYLSAASLILKIMTSPSEANDLRAASAVATGVMGVTQAVRPLLDIVNSSSTEISYSAIVALGELRAREAVPSLIKHLNSNKQSVRIAAAEALRKIGKDAISAVPRLRQLAEEGTEAEQLAANAALSQIL